MLTCTGEFILLVTATAAMFACGIQGQLECVTSTKLSCTEGIIRGLKGGIETRLLFSVNFTCNGTIVGWTVSGRKGGGTQFPKLQVWRSDISQGQDFYFKPGKDIQVDAEGTACEIVTKTCSQIFQCRLSSAHQASVQPGDILGVELPPLNNNGFELFFLGGIPGGTQDHFIFRQQLNSTVRIITKGYHSFQETQEQLQVSLEVSQASNNISSDETSPTKGHTNDVIEKRPCSTCSQSKLGGAITGAAASGVVNVILAAILFVILIHKIRKRTLTTRDREVLQETRLSLKHLMNKDQILTQENECYHTGEAYRQYW